MDNQQSKGLKVIITGATGMVGEGVLIACLKHESIARILIINRRHFGITHPKLKEIIHQNFHDLSPIEDLLTGYDACFFCAGVSSLGKQEAEFRHLTYDLTLHVAQTLAKQNPGMTFCYVSGAGTDSSAQGKQMWARVKGKTENDLMKLSFKSVYNFRPGFLVPAKGMKNTKSYYKYVGWLAPVVRKLAPRYICTLEEFGNAMIGAARYGYHQAILEVPDIKALASRVSE